MYCDNCQSYFTCAHLLTIQNLLQTIMLPHEVDAAMEEIKETMSARCSGFEDIPDPVRPDPDDEDY